MDKESCPYCSGEKPLTDKVFEDGSKFDDFQSIRIDNFGKRPLIVALTKKKYFDSFSFLSEEQKKTLSFSSCVCIEISYCPKCGRKLI